MKLEPQDRFLIAGTAGSDVKTVKRWEDPETRKRMRPSVVRRLDQAARELGFVPEKAA